MAALGQLAGSVMGLLPRMPGPIDPGEAQRIQLYEQGQQFNQGMQQQQFLNTLQQQKFQLGLLQSEQGLKWMKALADFPEAAGAAISPLNNMGFDGAKIAAAAEAYRKRTAEEEGQKARMEAGTRGYTDVQPIPPPRVMPSGAEYNLPADQPQPSFTGMGGIPYYRMPPPPHIQLRETPRGIVPFDLSTATPGQVIPGTEPEAGTTSAKVVGNSLVDVATGKAIYTAPMGWVIREINGITGTEKIIAYDKSNPDNQKILYDAHPTQQPRATKRFNPATGRIETIP